MIKPLEDKVLVQVSQESEKVTSSGLVIAGAKDDAPDTAKVIAVGDGITLANGNKISIPVKPGDTVIFSKYKGTDVSHNSEEFILLSYRDILAVVDA